jgi:phosphate transport system permease protein
MTKIEKQARQFRERLITRIIQAAGYLGILYIALISLFLLREGLPTLAEVPLLKLFSTRWYPIENYFGVMPLVLGSLAVTLAATVLAVPLGVGTAVYISEVAPGRLKTTMKSLVEILAGIPSVVLGFLGILILNPFLRITFNLPTGLTALTGAILLCWSAIPSIVSVAEDALNAVPPTYREAALALGATEWQTIWGVTVPAARSGILTAIMLGIGRVIGETMAVMMVTGNAPTMPDGLRTFIEPIRTMTATIASEMGEVANGSTHYHVLFFIGIILFLFSLVINVIVYLVSTRKIKRAERLLS